MSQISDEMLMAYADGELDEKERRRVEGYLATSSEGPKRLATYASTGRALTTLFDRTLPADVPQYLIDVVKFTGCITPQIARGAQTANATVIRLKAAHRGSTSSLPQWMLAAACFTSLAVGLGVHWFLKQPSLGANQSYASSIADGGSKIALEPLAQALEGEPSGSIVTRIIDGQQAAIKLVFTFVTANADYCRQYEIGRSEKASLGGVACRMAGGRWRIEGQIAISAQHSGDNKIVSAGSENRTPVDAIVDRMISGDVLSVDEEALAMKSGWR